MVFLENKCALSHHYLKISVLNLAFRARKFEEYLLICSGNTMNTNYVFDKITAMRLLKTVKSKLSLLNTEVWKESFNRWRQKRSTLPEQRSTPIITPPVSSLLGNCLVVDGMRAIAYLTSEIESWKFTSKCSSSMSCHTYSQQCLLSIFLNYLSLEKFMYIRKSNHEASKIGVGY